MEGIASHVAVEKDHRDMVTVVASGACTVPHHPEMPVAPAKHSHLRLVVESSVDIIAVSTQEEIGGARFLERFDDRVVLAKKDAGHLVLAGKGSRAQGCTRRRCY